MKIQEFAQKIFFGEQLEDKLLSVKQLDYFDLKTTDQDFEQPARSSCIEFSEDKVKFPKGQNLFTDKGKAIALHSFANHELLAIEIMAMCLLRFPHETPEQLRFKKALVKTLKDEQKHFKMYQSLLLKLGYKFGDFPRSSFFWKWAKLIKTADEYLCIMAITFEGANLDFAHYYAHLFRENGDIEIANILDQVFEDEITHVAVGSHYLDRWRDDQNLWDYYCKTLPFPITPARAKGMKFYKEARLKSGLDIHFVNQLEKYQDNFRVTQRKAWKKPTESI